MSAVAQRPRTMPLADDYEGEDSRFAIYSVRPPASPDRQIGVPPSGARHRIAETSLEGIGLCLQTLRGEDEITDDSRVGIFDRLDRYWLVNPWARGDLR